MYATEQDFLARFDGQTAEAGDKAIGLALADASAVIDTYLCKRYNLPFEPAQKVPSIIRRLCVDLACYLWARADELLSEDIRHRYDDAISTLKDIAKGIIDLPIKEQGTGNTPGENPGDTQGSGAVFIEGPPRLFGRGRGF